MNIAVRYFSRGGNTKKVAEAIAEATEAEALDCSEAPLTQQVDLLFLGGSVYGFEMDEHIKGFIAGLDPAVVKCTAVFGTSALVKSGNGEMVKLLREKGIRVLDQNFHCWGAFSFMRPKHPNDKDLRQAADFAHSAVRDLE